MELIPPTEPTAELLLALSLTVAQYRCLRDLDMQACSPAELEELKRRGLLNESGTITLTGSAFLQVLTLLI